MLCLVTLNTLCSTYSLYPHQTHWVGLLPDTQNCELRLHRECRQRFSRHRGLAIPTCITAHAWRTYRDVCRNADYLFPLKSVAEKTFPAFPVHAPLAILGNWQGWGQFQFFNSIPIPVPLFSIPIPIPLLTISFNSNSNSNSGDFNSNSNSNSGDFKSQCAHRQSHFWKWLVDVFFEIDYDYINKVHVYKIIVINTISPISLVKWNGYDYTASWLILYQ